MDAQPSTARIADVGADAELAAVARELFAEYQRELGIDLAFQGFDEEVASLPGPYAAPAGCLLLATVGANVVGCVGLRPRDRADAELKRLYVRPPARGTGIARALTVRALDHARARAYARVVLDTLPTMASAQALYASLGFREIEPYRHNPVAGTRFLGLDLRG
jgi:ribosomal protein S18 acetylase RimI-like enzyme